MAFQSAMSLIRSGAIKKAPKKKTKKTSPKVYQVDGIRYKTAALVKYHKEFKDDPLVKSFSLPSIKEAEQQMKTKFGAFKTVVNGFEFDSIMEARFYVYLLHLKKDGTIVKFERQVPFELQPGYRDPFTKKAVLPIKYIADFVITMKDGPDVVVDVKGSETAEFKIKWKMLGYVYPQYLRMCTQWKARTKSWEDLDDIKAEKKKKKTQKTKSKGKE